MTGDERDEDESGKTVHDDLRTCKEFELANA
jgi:hypothetical protein